MSTTGAQQNISSYIPRVHCPYCGDNFLLSHGKVVRGLGVICPNLKCGSRIRMNLDLGDARPPTWRLA